MAPGDLPPTQTEAEPDSGDWPSEDPAEHETVDLGSQPVPLPPPEDGPVSLSDVLRAGPLEAYRARGATLGHYVVEAEIARGGMGRIYRAQHRDLGRRVALKVLLAGVDATERQSKRFLREATLGAGLLHPGIVRVHDYGVEDGLAYLALEFIEGTTLHGVLGDISPRELALLLADVAEALGYAHDQGVVHRDLKPANVMLRDSDGSPVLTDFGLARDLTVSSGLTKSGAAVGTPAYMAPEQTRGETPVPATDVFALGVLLYEGLTGDVPFEGSSLSDLYGQINTLNPKAPHSVRAGVPRAISDVCMRALTKAPGGRYPSGAEMAAALRAAADGQGPPRRAPVIPLVGLALLGAFAALALVFTSPKPEGTNGGQDASPVDPAPPGPPLPERVDPLPRRGSFSSTRPITGEGWALEHGLSTLQLEVRDQERKQDGYALDELTVNGRGRSPSFAAIWRRDDGTSRDSLLAVPHRAFASEWTRRRDANWSLHRTARWGKGSGLRLSGLWRKGKRAFPFMSYSDLPLDKLRAKDASAAKRGFRLASLSASPGDKGGFCVVWHRSDRKGSSVFDQDAVGFGRWLSDKSRRGLRLSVLAVHGPTRDPRFSGAVIADPADSLTFHALPPDDYQVIAEVLAGSGYQPVVVNEFGPSERRRRITSCWVRDSAPRVWRTSGPPVPELVDCDDLLQAGMKELGVSAAALAVVRDGRLVLARGYTWAPPSQQPTLPTSLFRIGSLSQPLTALGILRLVDEGRLSLDDSLGELFPELNSSRGPSWDLRLPTVTVRQLLQHRGGWDRERSRGTFSPRYGYDLHDPAFLSERFIAAGLGTDLPIGARQIVDYMNAQPLEFTPGDRFQPSSYGYLVLGRIIEAKSGRSYEGYMRKDLLPRFGPSDLFIADGRLSRRAYGAVLQEGGELTPDAFGDGSVVPLHYGGWTQAAMDAHAGWSGTVVDLARVLAGLATSEDVLSAESRAAMWTAQPDRPFGLGWSVESDGRISAVANGHQGTYGYMELRGSSGFVLLLNRLVDAGPLADKLNAHLQQHAAWPAWDLFPR